MSGDKNNDSLVGTYVSGVCASMDVAAVLAWSSVSILGDPGDKGEVSLDIRRIGIGIPMTNGCPVPTAGLLPIRASRETIESRREVSTSMDVKGSGSFMGERSASPYCKEEEVGGTTWVDVRMGAGLRE